MAEIKMHDNTDIGTQSIDTQKPVQPESNMTASEARNFWDSVFKGDNVKVPEIVDEKQQEYKDDNGKVYRQGDTLLPNNTFEINGYTYTTDDQGRVISVEGTLKQGDPSAQRDMDGMPAVGKGDQQEGDHRGHLIGHRFDGSGGIENLVPMDGKLNQGDYKKLENTLAKALENGSEVTVKVEPVYEGDSNRPSAIKVTYTIDGEKETVVFKNESGDKQ